MKNLAFITGMIMLCIPFSQALSLGENISLDVHSASNSASEASLDENIKLKEMTLTCISHIQNCHRIKTQQVGAATSTQKNYSACIIKSLYPLAQNGNLIAPAYIAQAYHTLGLKKDYEKWLQYFKTQDALSSSAKQEVISRLNQ